MFNLILYPETIERTVFIVAIIALIIGFIAGLELGYSWAKRKFKK